MSLREAIFFDPGQDTLQPGARRLLVEIGQAIEDVSEQPIRLEGHTDNVPIRTSAFPSNWELSAARAIAVLNILVHDVGVPAHRISVAGYGPHRPVAANMTPEQRALNRRVDIVVLSRSAAAMAPRQRLDRLPRRQKPKEPPSKAREPLNGPQPELNPPSRDREPARSARHFDRRPSRNDGHRQIRS